MSLLGAQTGVSTGAFGFGIPVGASFGWTGAGGARACTVIDSLTKGRAATVSEQHGSAGEFMARRRIRQGYRVSITVAPNSTTAALAKAILNDPPNIMDLVTIASATGDTQINQTYIVDSEPKISYTPEGRGTISMDLFCPLADDGTTPLALSALTVS